MDMMFVSAGKVETYSSVDEVPYKVTGYTEDLSKRRAEGDLVHRAELDNQPKFYGFLGPMWDGGKLRYETQQVYDALSC